MNKDKISIIGLGYVGLPLAIEFGKKYSTLGYDLSKTKINNLLKGIDLNNEITKKQFKSSKHLSFTDDHKLLKQSNIKILSVPTPINKKNIPDLKILSKATKTVGLNLNRGDIIILESTVYPGVTEEICAPILEKFSKLKWKKDFNLAYSPERINPGDKKYTLTNIPKLVSADNTKTLLKVKKLYQSIIKAKIIRCSSIKIAESAKVIENTQRDINIAFINELKLIFDKLKIDFHAVLEAANTKWNFLDFKPGLVGGHCIGVDPYYLAHISKLNKYNPKLILSGRKLNNSMGRYYAKKAEIELKKNYPKKENFNVLILGFTFKENCSDIRNTKVVDIYKYFYNKNINVEIYDPNIDVDQASKKYNFQFIQFPKFKYYHLVIIAVSHAQFIKMGRKSINKFLKSKKIIYQVKKIYD